MTDLYHRFDGYDDLKSLLEGSDEEILVELAAGPDPHPRCRHGGQPTGAVRRLPPARQQALHTGRCSSTPAPDEYPFDLWVLIGNVRAATQEGWFAHRYLDDQEDFNRVWDRAGHHPHAPLCLVDPRGAPRGRPGGRHRPAQQRRAEPLLRDTPRAHSLEECGWRRCADLLLRWRFTAHT